VLGAFIRERSRAPRERPDDPPEDVNAGLRVVSRLVPKSDVVLDLRDADLRNTDLRRLPAERVRLQGAKLEGAQLPQVTQSLDPIGQCFPQGRVSGVTRTVTGVNVARRSCQVLHVGESGRPSAPNRRLIQSRKREPGT
jgi:Pentapeptide repeats (8 copies)